MSNLGNRTPYVRTCVRHTLIYLALFLKARRLVCLLRPLPEQVGRSADDGPEPCRGHLERVYRNLIQQQKQQHLKRCALFAAISGILHYYCVNVLLMHTHTVCFLLGTHTLLSFGAEGRLSLASFFLRLRRRRLEEESARVGAKKHRSLCVVRRDSYLYTTQHTHTHPPPSYLSSVPQASLS